MENENVWKRRFQRNKFGIEKSGVHEREKKKLDTFFRFAGNWFSMGTHLLVLYHPVRYAVI